MMVVNRIFPEIYLPAEEIDFFQHMVYPLVLNPGECFIELNTRCDRIAYVDSGVLCKVIIHEQKPHILSRYVKDDFVTQFSGFIGGENSRTAIRALEPTRLTIISDLLFHQLCQRHVCWIQFWLKVFGTEISDLIEQERYFHGPD
jgi:CRP-like cAMP-binding protein